MLYGFAERAWLRFDGPVSASFKTVFGMFSLCVMAAVLGALLAGITALVGYVVGLSGPDGYNAAAAQALAVPGLLFWLFFTFKACRRFTFDESTVGGISNAVSAGGLFLFAAYLLSPPSAADRSLIFALLAVSAVLHYVAILRFNEATWINAGSMVFSFLGGAQSRQLQTTGGAADAAGTKAGIVNRAERPRYSSKQVIGMEAVMAQMGEAIDEALRGGKNGILLAGNPGNGKTMLAEAAAGDKRLPFIRATFGDMVSMWVGETTQRAMKVFDDAVKQAPCLLFLDEIDSILVNRDGVKSAEAEAPKTVNAILTKLVDIRGKGVVIMAATNFPERLDAAGVREGRFDLKIEIPDPNYEERVGLLNMVLTKERANVVPGSVENVAKRWEGFSVSRLLSVAKEAARAAAGTAITNDDLMRALRAVQGFKGDRLAEDTPLLDDLYMDALTMRRLKGIVQRMADPFEVEAAGGTAPSGILFHGPSGTGKTLVARAVAKETDWAFLAASGFDLIAQPEKIDDLIAKALNLRPCIVFIDEADDLLMDRGYSTSRAVTNKLLSAMDGAGRRLKDVVFIAATNHPDVLDGATLRGGRFSEQIEFLLPSREIVERFAADWIGKMAGKAKFTSDLTVGTIADALTGLSLATIRDVLSGVGNEVFLDAEAGGIATLRHLEASMQQRHVEN